MMRVVFVERREIVLFDTVGWAAKSPWPSSREECYHGTVLEVENYD
jgi:hypothetical protein